MTPPSAVQFPLAANETASRELAVAVTIAPSSPKFAEGSGGKVILWFAFPFGRGVTAKRNGKPPVLAQLLVSHSCTLMFAPTKSPGERLKSWLSSLLFRG